MAQRSGLQRVSIQLEPKTIRRLDRLAGARKSSRPAIIREAVDRSLTDMESEVLGRVLAERSA